MKKENKKADIIDINKTWKDELREFAIIFGGTIGIILIIIFILWLYWN